MSATATARQYLSPAMMEAKRQLMKIIQTRQILDSDYTLKGPKRLEGEDWEKYQMRRKNENWLRKMSVRLGTLINDSGSVGQYRNPARAIKKAKRVERKKARLALYEEATV